MWIYVFGTLLGMAVPAIALAPLIAEWQEGQPRGRHRATEREAVEQEARRVEQLAELRQVERREQLIAQGVRSEWKLS